MRKLSLLTLAWVLVSGVAAGGQVHWSYSGAEGPGQ